MARGFEVQKTEKMKAPQSAAKNDYETNEPLSVELDATQPYHSIWELTQARKLQDTMIRNYESLSQIDKDHCNVITHRIMLTDFTKHKETTK